MKEHTDVRRYGVIAASVVAGVVVGSFFGFLAGYRAVPEDRLAALPVEERRELLWEAVRADLPEATRLLLDGFDVNAGADETDEGEATLLHDAVDINAPRSADVLLAAGADPYAEAGGETPLGWIRSEEMWRVFEKYARTTPEIERIPRPVFDGVLPPELDGPILLRFNRAAPPESVLSLLREKYPATEFAVDETAFPDGGATLDLTLERLSPERIRFERASRKKGMILSGVHGEGMFVKRHGFWVVEDQTWWDE